MTEPLTPFGRIAIGIDFSPSSLYALDIARQRFPGAQLRLLHAVDVRLSAAPDMMGGLTPVSYDPALLEQVEQSDARQLGELLRPGESQAQLVGEPVSALLDAAQEWGADLIVVGTHARGPLEHFFLGSTAEKLVARSPIPVLTVRVPRGHRLAGERG